MRQYVGIAVEQGITEHLNQSNRANRGKIPRFDELKISSGLLTLHPTSSSFAASESTPSSLRKHSDFDKRFDSKCSIQRFKNDFIDIPTCKGITEVPSEF